MSRRLRVPVAIVVAIVASAGVALAATLALTSKSLTTFSADQAAPTTTAGGFTPSSLVLANRASPTAGTSGFAESGDTVTVTFSHAIKQSSLCSNWTTDLASQALTGVTVTIDNDGPDNTLNDRVVIGASPAACTGGFQFGHVDLGSKGFVTSTGSSFKDVPFTGSQIDVTGSTIKITLGTSATGGTNGELNPISSQTTAVYTPDSDIKSSTNVAVSGTASVTGVQL